VEERRRFPLLRTKPRNKSGKRSTRADHQVLARTYLPKGVWFSNLRALGLAMVATRHQVRPGLIRLLVQSHILLEGLNFGKIAEAFRRRVSNHAYLLRTLPDYKHGESSYRTIRRIAYELYSLVGATIPAKLDCLFGLDYATLLKLMARFRRKPPEHNPSQYWGARRGSITSRRIQGKPVSSTLIRPRSHKCAVPEGEKKERY